MFAFYLSHQLGVKTTLDLVGAVASSGFVHQLAEEGGVSQFSGNSLLVTGTGILLEGVSRQIWHMDTRVSHSTAFIGHRAHVNGQG